MPLISQVNMRVMRGEEAREIWFFFETDHDNLFDFNEDLAEDGTVYGTRIETVHEAQGQRREISRYEFIVGKEAFLSASAPTYELLPPRVAQVEQA